jgi:hypothetical protein
MALTKAAVSIQASAPITPGTPVTSASVNLTAVYGGEILYKITNGVSAPTTAPTIEIQASHDNSNWYRAALVAGDIVASSVNSLPIPVPIARMYVRSICTAGATNGSTMEVNMEQVTAY